MRGRRTFLCGDAWQWCPIPMCFVALGFDEIFFYREDPNTCEQVAAVLGRADDLIFRVDLQEQVVHIDRAIRRRSNDGNFARKGMSTANSVYLQGIRTPHYFEK